MSKVIITCAVTGSIHTPSMSPALPVTAEEIAEAAFEAAEAGAAIVHLHARDPSDGRPDQSPEAFEHDWEYAMLEGSHDLVFRNSFKDIRFALETLDETGTRFEFECYDTGHLHNLYYFYVEGLVMPPLFIQTVFGLLGGIRAHPEDVMHMKRTADRLFGENHRWSVLGAGRSQMPIAAMGAAV